MPALKGEWHHALTWSTEPHEGPGEITHRVDQDSTARDFRTMIELCGCTIERCRRELLERGEEV